MEELADRLIREAMEAGEFDHLPGVGKLLPGVGQIDDEYWWLRGWVKRNQVQPDRLGRRSPESD